MIITTMTAAHVPQIAALEQCCFSAPWSERSIASELDNDLAYWLVCLEGDSVLAYAGTQTVLEETDMMNIAVHPDHRRRGLAAALLGRLLEDLARRGSHSLTLEVRVSNAPARSLYERVGFAEVGRRKNYYQDPREDALILRRELEP